MHPWPLVIERSNVKGFFFILWYLVLSVDTHPLRKISVPEVRTVARCSTMGRALGAWGWNGGTCGTGSPAELLKKSLTLIFPVVLDTRTTIHQCFPSRSCWSSTYLDARPSPLLTFQPTTDGCRPIPTPMIAPRVGRRTGKTPSLQYVALVKCKRAKYTPQIINSTCAESSGATP